MISVCIATYNGEKYVKQQLASILCQIAKDDEIIISDDGSDDNTLSIVSEFNDSRIKVIDGAHRHSPAFNFENALRHAKGEYIFLSDQDDVWMPNKVEVMLKYLHDVDCVVSDCVVVDGDLNVLNESFYVHNGTKTGIIYNLFVKNGYLGCCMAFNRKIMDAILPFPCDIPMHDIWIGNVAAVKYKVKFIPEKLIKFRRHKYTNSPTAHKSIYSLKEKLYFRYVMCKDLFCK